jgi:serine/threonine protein kinase
MVHTVTTVWPRAEIDLGNPGNMERVLEKLGPGRYELFLLALPMDARTGTESFHWLSRMLAQDNCPPLIVVGEGGDELHAAKSIKLGAADYIPKRLLAHDVMAEALRDALSDGIRRREAALWGNAGPPRLTGYKIIRSLARTRRSSVFLALSEPLDREIVLKLMNRPGEGEDQRMYQRFQREFSLTVDLDSARLARIFEFGETDDSAYIAMEYFPEGDLKQRMQGPLLPKQAVRYAYQVAEALAVIHEAGIVHRDLKPSNIMLRPDDSVALIDFGLAYFDGATRLTAAKEIQGTPHYISPEQAVGDAVDERSDLYSLGVIMFEMLSGQRPYVGSTAMEILDMHREAPLPQLPKFVARFQPLINQLMAKDPVRRLSSAGRVMQEITQYYPYLESRSA